MKWDGQRESRNIEDRRQAGAGRRLGGGRGIGLGGIVVAMLLAWVFGVNPLTVLSLLGGAGAPGAAPQATQGVPADDPQARFVAVVVADTEDVWNQQFAQLGRRYREPVLVLFRGRTSTACGQGQAAMGPFYCPADEKVYIDLGFYDTLRERLGAPGDFAQAYVIAHEIGHHVQHLLGITEQVDQLRGRAPEAQVNAASVRLELQADCLAGVWAHHTERSRQMLEDGDIEEAMRAAAAIGDDTLQKRSQGYAVPETFTHGTSQQRMAWFRRGLQGGSLAQCNTFDAPL